jgi:hypothetical protein
VVALEQDLAATAGAHHVMAEVFEASVGITGTEEDGHGGEEQCGVYDPRNSETRRTRSDTASTKSRSLRQAQGKLFAALRMTNQEWGRGAWRRVA